MANMELGELSVKIGADVKELAAAAATVKTKLNGMSGNFKTFQNDVDASVKRVNNSFISMQTAMIAFAAVGVAKLNQALLGSIKIASDFQESAQRFGIVFGDQMEKGQAAVNELTNSYNMSTKSAQTYLAGVQDLLVPLGVASGKAADLSSKIVKLAADMESAYNVPLADVMRDIQSALVGNSETVRKYGVVINEATIKEEAMKSGLIGLNGELSNAAKVQATYNLIVNSTATAQGDVARSTDTYAYAVRKLKVQWEELQTTIGGIALPSATGGLGGLTEQIKRLNDFMKENKDTIVSWVGSLLTVGKVIAGLLVVSVVTKGISALTMAISTRGLGGAIMAVVSSVTDFLFKLGTTFDLSTKLEFSFKSLSRVLRTLSAVGVAFFVGWEIGTLLNKFESVRFAGIALVDVLMTGFIKLKYTTLDWGNAILIFVENIGGSVVRFGARVAYAGGMIARAIPGKEKWGQDVMDKYDAIVESSLANEQKRLKGRKNYNKEQEAELARHNEIVKSMYLGELGPTVGAVKNRVTGSTNTPPPKATPLYKPETKMTPDQLRDLWIASEAELYSATEEINAKYFEDQKKIQDDFQLSELERFDATEALNAKYFADQAEFQKQWAEGEAERFDVAEAANAKWFEDQKGVREAEINLQLSELDASEKAGTYHRATLTDRVRLTKELVANQENLLVTMNRDADVNAWNNQVAKIQQLRASLADLNKEVANQIPWNALAAGVDKFQERASDMSTQLQTLADTGLQSLADSMGDAITAFALGKESFSEFTESFLMNILKQINAMLAYQAVKQIVGLAMNAYTTSSSLSAAGSASAGWEPNYAVGPYATGGVVPGHMNSFRRFAGGGMTSRPMLALVGDNKSGRELVIPEENIKENSVSGYTRDKNQGKSHVNINLIDPSMVPAIMSQYPEATLNVINADIMKRGITYQHIKQVSRR